VPVAVIYTGPSGNVVVPRQQTTTTTEASTKTAPNPILPTGKEMAWGLGSFLVLVVLMRYWLYPKLKKSMDTRYAKIQADVADAERLREDASLEVARYQAAIAEANAEAARALEAARRDVEADRNAKITAANARIAERKAAAAAEIDAARQAALARTEPIVVEIAATAATRVLGTTVDRGEITSLAADVMGAGVAGQ
jgi:F-type H+-transporting ATPase subunit b